MYQKLFQIMLVLFLVAVSVAMLAVVISVVMSALTPQLMAADTGGGGITGFAWGVSQKQFRLMIVAVSLIVAGCYLFFRRRRFHR